ncbi:hypothetical protein ACFFTM_16060 [Pseudoduganella plicata]|uniref:Lipoprotein n=1 Tax=Pseudoduganella plicata TaxID=321984 RepID=A0A4P7BL22_9BURK|nr:hypothetical protein [Pseudoduganella plicata]QBQ39073.1 hypothetical protein E1742_25215 [Pseudoduganella plicata]GGY87012.1 hypothetical protein GCM10007388_20400 [Pseudoduganella plicata]
MTRRILTAVLLPLALSGCLEVNQHPAWKKGEYAGKTDNRHFQTRFHNDRLAWMATIMNRNAKQNEYNRANP